MLTTNSGWQLSSIDQAFLGRDSFSASQSHNLSLRDCCRCGNIKFCSAPNLPRRWKRRSLKMSMTRVKYVPLYKRESRALTCILQAYGRAKAKFGFISGLYSQIQNVLFIQYDVLPKIWSVTGLLLARYLPSRFQGEISHSVLFFFTFNIISQILSLPPSYYGTFVLEEKFGFNKQTLQLWLSDMLKSQALMVVLGTPLLSAFLKIIQVTGTKFFYYLWLFSIVVQLFAITIYPTFILPLFNKLSPLEPGELKSGVEKLASNLKFPLSSLYVIDGSKRSAHSNAYFFGLPWKKHIVIYDTLIEKSEPQEVVAVLGHELGHWSLSHTTKLMGIAQVSCNSPVKWARLLTQFSSICSTSSPSSPSSSTMPHSTTPSASSTNVPSSLALSSSPTH